MLFLMCGAAGCAGSDSGVAVSPSSTIAKQDCLPASEECCAEAVAGCQERCPSPEWCERSCGLVDRPCLDACEAQGLQCEDDCRKSACR